MVPTLIPLAIKVKELAAGHAHTLLLDQQGHVYSFGSNEYGQLGQGNRETRSEPSRIRDIPESRHVYAGHSHSGIIDDFDNFYTFGCNVDCRLMLPNE